MVARVRSSSITPSGCTDMRWDCWTGNNSGGAPYMRNRLLSVAAAATLVLTAAAPAFAADSTVASAPKAYTCLASATVTATSGGATTTVYSKTTNFSSVANLSTNGTITRTYTINGVTYVATASVTCTR